MNTKKKSTNLKNAKRLKVKQGLESGSRKRDGVVNKIEKRNKLRKQKEKEITNQDLTQKENAEKINTIDNDLDDIQITNSIEEIDIQTVDSIEKIDIDENTTSINVKEVNNKNEIKKLEKVSKSFTHSRRVSSQNPKNIGNPSSPVLYVSPSSPLISIIKRANKLLESIPGSNLQAKNFLNQGNLLSNSKIPSSISQRHLTIYAQGRAIPNAILAATSFQKLNHTVKINTSTVKMIDDFEDKTDPDQDPFSRERNVSQIEIKVYIKL